LNKLKTAFNKSYKECKEKTPHTVDTRNACIAEAKTDYKPSPQANVVLNDYKDNLNGVHLKNRNECKAKDTFVKVFDCLSKYIEETEDDKSISEIFKTNKAAQIKLKSTIEGELDGCMNDDGKE
jgi:hypothetical protein